MTDTAVAALRAELVAAQAVLAPQLRGLNDIVKAPGISGDAIELLNEELRTLHSRDDVIAAVLVALDALDADGYPNRDPIQIPTEIFVLLSGVVDDVMNAISIFTPSPEVGDFNPSEITLRLAKAEN